VIDGSNPQEPVHTHYPGDDLLTPLARRRGLPIGNLTSQFFANVYLDGLDHFARRCCARPTCDTSMTSLSFTTTPKFLAEWRMRIADYLARRRLSLHPRKTGMLPTAAPSIFLGFVLLPGGRRLPEENVRRFRNRLRGLRDRQPHIPVMAGSPVRRLRKTGAVDPGGNVVTIPRLPSVAGSNKPPGWDRWSPAEKVEHLLGLSLDRMHDYLSWPADSAPRQARLLAHA
jgi:hypothetical protein